MVQLIAGNLGFSLGLCLLHWPIGFSAVKGSLHLKYRWQPFLLGYVLSVVGLTAVITLWGTITREDPTSGAMGFAELIFQFPVPLGVAVVVTLLLRGRFVENKKRIEPAGVDVPLVLSSRPGSAGTGSRRINQPMAWCLFLVGVAVILSLGFPTWELPNQGHRRLGRGSVMGPTDSSLEKAEYQCANVLYDAEKVYTQLKSSLAADEQRWQDAQRESQTMERDREEAIRRIRSQGRDPNRVSIDGRDLVYDRYGLPSEPPATAVPVSGGDREEDQPRAVLAGAASKLADARESCRRAVEVGRSSARIDFASLSYQTGFVCAVGGLLCLSVWLIRRPRGN